MTQNGEPCLKWSEVGSGKEKKEGDHNYCRNPTKKEPQDWCYYQEEKKKVGKGMCAVVTCGKDNLDSIRHSL